MTKFQINASRRQYITFSQLMAMANKDASAMLKKNRKIVQMAQGRQKQYPNVTILIPSKLTWGECLSRAMKQLYSESYVVAQLDRDMVIHNTFYRSWEEPGADEMQRWEAQRYRRSYTGD